MPVLLHLLNISCPTYDLESRIQITIASHNQETRNFWTCVKSVNKKEMHLVNCDHHNDAVVKKSGLYCFDNDYKSIGKIFLEGNKLFCTLSEKITFEIGENFKFVIFIDEHTDYGEFDFELKDINGNNFKFHIF